MVVRITQGDGTASIASELIGNNQYQQIKVIGGETGSTSVWGITPDGSAKVSVIGIPNVNVSGSVFATISGAGSIIAIPTGSVIAVLQSSSIIGVVTGSVVAVPTGNQSVSGAVFVSGSVLAQQTGTVITSIVSSIPSSVLVGASIFGQLPAGTAPIGSVAVLQGTNPWETTNVGSIITTQIGSVITVWKDSSVLAVPVGSTIALLQTPSIVGTFSEDANHTQGQKGLFVMGVRNDTLSSVTSADTDYTLFAVGPAGETVSANAPITKWVRGTADLRVVLGASVTAIAAQGASIFTYITGVQIANMGSASVLVTLAGGLGSILGYSIAPAGGGSNIYYPNALKTGENSAFTASISGTASVLVSAQGFTAKI